MVFLNKFQNFVEFIDNFINNIIFYLYMQLCNLYINIVNIYKVVCLLWCVFIRENSQFCFNVFDDLL